ncbi:MAG: ferrous iron transport protein B [Ruminococcaceae bacterium]|nr:ferrous iron transport protein B [Oscillospiraceae bacterium]
MGIRIALAGNPNSGKTTLFNALTGSNQYVGNWAGVTVEKKEGKLKKQNDVILTDLPGIYSLSPYTLEEVVARNYLINERPDAILNIVDGTNLERNLYLTTQLMELGIPVVVAINMMDIVRRNGDEIDTEILSKRLGCRVIEISALKGDSIDTAADLAIEAAKAPRKKPRHIFSGVVEHALAHIEEAAIHNMPEEQQRWYSVKIFERDEKVLQSLKLNPSVIKHMEYDIKEVEEIMDDDAESIITNERYNYIVSIMQVCYKRKHSNKMTISDKIDRVVTNRILALPIFALIMFLVYYLAIGSVGNWTVDFMNEKLFGEWIIPAANSGLESLNCPTWLVGLVSDGILSGVGAVLGFVPQMFILFLLLSLLEDCGYMARIAFIMDRLFRKFGLSGKSFIPMLVGVGCGVPGVMASRTIENERDRRMTIMTTCFIPCGAKMPIIGLFAGAIFGGSGLVAVSAYFMGIASVIISGIMLKKTKIFSGDPAPFVMELPSYHAPVPINIFRATWERGWSFIKKAGTVILLSTIILWFLQGFGFENGAFVMVENNDNSLLAYIGNAVAFIFAPLGFGNWKSAVATFTGLMAKEGVVSTFGVLLNVSGEVTEASSALHLAVSQHFGGSGLVAYSFMAFNLLCAPCFAAMGAIKREMNSPKWTFFAIGYMTAFAYAVSLMIYQFGSLFTGNGNIIGTIFASIILLFFVYMLVKPYKESTKLTRNLK